MITSLHSPHVERVQALLGSRGNKARRETGLFVAEGMQSVREALQSDEAAPQHRFAKIRTKTVFVTEKGRHLLASEDLVSERCEFIDVAENVMAAMTDTVTPQGVLALCEIPERNFLSFSGTLHNEKTTIRLAYFWQIQDPGNAGTVIRNADAFGFDAILFSPDSVDPYSPKVVRATAGSLWHLPVFENCAPADLLALNGINIFITDSVGGISLADAVEQQGSASIWIFGNEARGIAEFPASVAARAQRVSIPMNGQAESLNIASATSIVMYSARLQA